MQTEDVYLVDSPRHSSWEIGFDLSDDRGRGRNLKFYL